MGASTEASNGGTAAGTGESSRMQSTSGAGSAMAEETDSHREQVPSDGSESTIQHFIAVGGKAWKDDLRNGSCGRSTLEDRVGGHGQKLRRFIIGTTEDDLDENQCEELCSSAEAWRVRAVEIISTTSMKF